MGVICVPGALQEKLEPMPLVLAGVANFTGSIGLVYS